MSLGIWRKDNRGSGQSSSRRVLWKTLKILIFLWSRIKGLVKMGKKYNSLMTIAFSVLHDEEDGSDITAHHIRERLTERINCDDQSL